MYKIKMKSSIIGIFALFVFALFAQSFAADLYVKVPEENLRMAPNGKKIGTVLEGTKATVLVAKDNWVKVQVTGWIWKPSLTSSKPATATGEFRALHILVKTKAEAEEVLKLLKSGKDFKEVAKNKSISPSAAQGGDLGYFNKGDFDPKIEAAIAALKVGEISGIVETSYGFNIFKRIK
ncbi:MAG: hypothetical protein GWP06_10705 [Actinobacteria bacterium]|nr:hypothetical protein [Actinomycetota bacterium]